MEYARRRYQQQKSMIEICVLDNGSGISEQEQFVIFDDFYRSERGQQQDNIPGIGLGLSVVRRFCELLGHSIQCRSILNRGSCFSITIPMADRAQVASSKPSAWQGYLDGLNIIYVDDDPQNLLATSTLLEHWKCNVFPINSVAAARAYLDTRVIPDVLLMDYELGDTEVNGIELAQDLIHAWQSLIPVGKSVLICMVSAYSDPGFKQRLEALGFHLLSKPVKPAKLRALLSQYGRDKAM